MTVDLEVKWTAFCHLKRDTRDFSREFTHWSAPIPRVGDRITLPVHDAKETFTVLNVVWVIEGDYRITYRSDRVEVRVILECSLTETP